MRKFFRRLIRRIRKKRMAVLEVRSKLGKRIRLTQKQWAHIREEHAELDNQQAAIGEALEQPDFVCYNMQEGGYEYYKHYRETPVMEKYLKVVTRHLNDEGFVITAFYLSRIQKRGRRSVYGEDIFDQL